MLRTAVIHKCRKQDHDPARPESEQSWCLYTHDGKQLLGRHPTEESAERQERAIQVHKHGALNNQNKKATQMSSTETTPQMVRYAGHLYVRAEEEIPEEPELEMDGEESLEEEMQEVDAVEALETYWQTILDKLPDDLEVDDEFEEAVTGIEDIIKMFKEPDDEGVPAEEEPDVEEDLG